MSKEYKETMYSIDEESFDDIEEYIVSHFCKDDIYPDFELVINECERRKLYTVSIDDLKTIAGNACEEVSEYYYDDLFEKVLAVLKDNIHIDDINNEMPDAFFPEREIKLTYNDVIGYFD